MRISKKAVVAGVAAFAVIAGVAGSAMAQQAGDQPPGPPPDPNRKAQVLAALQAGKVPAGLLSEDIKTRLAGRIDALVKSGIIDPNRLTRLQAMGPDQLQAEGLARLAQFRQDHPDAFGRGPGGGPLGGHGSPPGGDTSTTAQG